MALTNQHMLSLSLIHYPSFFLNLFFFFRFLYVMFFCGESGAEKGKEISEIKSYYREHVQYLFLHSYHVGFSSLLFLFNMKVINQIIRVI